MFFATAVNAATIAVTQTIAPTASLAIVGTGALTSGTGSVTLDVTPSNATSYTIAVAGTAAGTFVLTHTDGVTTVPLTVNIDGTAIATSGNSITNATVTNGTVNTHTLNLISGSTATSKSGSYSETLTVTVSAL